LARRLRLAVRQQRKLLLLGPLGGLAGHLPERAAARSKSAALDRTSSRSWYARFLSSSARLARPAYPQPPPLPRRSSTRAPDASTAAASSGVAPASIGASDSTSGRSIGRIFGAASVANRSRADGAVAACSKRRVSRSRISPSG